MSWSKHSPCAPADGTQPFAASSFWPEEALVLLIAALLPRGERTLRVGAVLYGAAMLAAFIRRRLENQSRWRAAR
jgi:hypothetical protein